MQFLEHVKVEMTKFSENLHLKWAFLKKNDTGSFFAEQRALMELKKKHGIVK
jgi:hypothetical protein